MAADPAVCRRALAIAIVAVATLAPLAALAEMPAEAEPTSSAKTVTARDYDPAAANSPAPDLKVSISQTQDLQQQGVTLTWSGGKQSASPQGTVGGADFLQIAQCWGDEPGSNGTRPDRRTCQYGGTAGWGATRDGNTLTESIAPEDEKYSADLGGYSYTGVPFVAYNAARVVDEKLAPADKVLTNTTINAAGQVVLKSPLLRFDNNEFFTALTTNEVKWAPSGADGTGATTFELQTAMQSPGLGCGIPTEGSSGTITGSSCWLVIIPRGESDNGSSLINTPGIWWESWQHHLAVKLDFKPLGATCQLGAAERQLAGSELIAGAIASWQPVVCQGASPFTLTQIPESDAVATAAGTAPSALAFTSRPLSLDRVSLATDPLVYAPVALGGISIAFAVDAFPNPQSNAEFKARAGLPLTSMKLTPRLLAKLLTASYVDSLPSGADLSHIGYNSFKDPGKNPRTLAYDPDFRAINDPEWSAQIIVGASIADALVPLGRSDLAERVWEYILADADAKAWLGGKADPWGMVVNPCFSTNSKVSAKCPADKDAPATAPLDLPREDFPKADPAEKPDTTGSDANNGSGPVNLVTWRPYTSGFTDGGYRVLRGDGMTLGGWDRFSTPPRFGKDQRQLLGSRKVIALTSTPAARLYQTTSAELRNPAGRFVAPDADGLLAAAAAMTPTTEQSRVVRFDPTSAKAKTAKDAYPLAIPVYAALNPKQTDASLRADYAKLITYAVGAGQTAGTDNGQLPPGYAPLPTAWRAQATSAAAAIKAGALPVATPTPSATSAATSPTASAAVQPTSQPQPGATDPSASGNPNPGLLGAATAADPGLGGLGGVVPATGLVGLAAALAIPLTSRFRRSP